MKKFRNYFVLCIAVLCLSGSVLCVQAEPVTHEEDYLDNIFVTDPYQYVTYSYNTETGNSQSGFPKVTDFEPFTIKEYQGHLNFITLRCDEFMRVSGKAEVATYNHSFRFYVVSEAPFKAGSSTITNAAYDSVNGIYYKCLASYAGAFPDNNTFTCSFPNQVSVEFSLSASDASVAEQLAYISDHVDSTQDDIGNDDQEWSEDLTLDVPKIVKTFDSTKGDYITFSNGADGYYVEIQGRWYTVDDIELYKENAVWKYKYHSIVKNSLSTWAKVDTDRLHTHSLGGINLRSTDTVYIKDIGTDSFNDLLSWYPIDNRSYTGGTNAVGNYFSGYSDALTYFKTMYGVNMFGVFNSYELYARYVYIDDQGNISVSKWAHFYTGLAKESGSSGSRWDDSDNMDQEYNNDEGLTDDDKDDLEEGGDSRSDPGATPKIDASQDWSDTIASLIDTSNQVFSLFKGLFGLMGSVPSMIASVFSFLPSWLINFISIALALVVILRFVGR